MSTVMIQVSDAPEIQGNPGSLNSAATGLRGAGQAVNGASDAVVREWGGLNNDNYNAPEAPAVKGSMPKIIDPADAIDANLKAAASALDTAASQLQDLKLQSEALKQDISTFVTTATSLTAAARNDPDAGIKSWRDDPVLVAENTVLWIRAGLIKTALDQSGADLAASLSALASPKPNFPVLTVEAGMPAGPSIRSGPVGGIADIDKVDEKGVRTRGGGIAGEVPLIAGSNGNTRKTPGGTSTWNLDGFLGLRGDASAVSQSGPGVNAAQLKAEGFAGASASYSEGFKTKNGSFGTGTSVDGMAGVRANGDLAYYAGPDGLAGRAGVNAFAGARADVNRTFSISGIKFTGGANGRAGIGATATADAAITPVGGKLQYDLGIAKGLGGGIQGQLTVDVPQIQRDLKDPSGVYDDFLALLRNQVGLTP